MALSLFVVVVWLACVCLHEFGHALVGYLGGDDSIKAKGYLSLNPAKYIDPGTSLIFPILIMVMGGIGLPGAAVYINESKLRNRAWRSATAAAGPAMSCLATLVLAWLITSPLVPMSRWMCEGLALVAVFNIATTILNLLPVPPLDGFHIIRPWLPGSVQGAISKFSGFQSIALIYMVFYFVPYASTTLWSITINIAAQLGVPPELFARGHQEFMKYSISVVPVLLFGIWMMRKGATADKAGQNPGRQQSPSAGSARTSQPAPQSDPGSASERQAPGAETQERDANERWRF